MTRLASSRPTSVRKKHIAFQGLAIAGGWVPIAIAAGQSVAIRIDSFALSTTAQYSLVIALGWLVQMLALPLAGKISDASINRGLSRRGLLATATIAMVVLAALLQTMQSVNSFATIWLLAQLPATVIITIAATNIAAEARNDLRGWAAGVAGMSFAFALLVGATVTILTSNNPDVLFLAPAIAGCLLILPALMTQPELPKIAPRVNHNAMRTHPWILLIIIALVFSGVAVGRIYAVPLIHQLGTEFNDQQVTETSASAVIAATILAMLGNLVAGRIIQAGHSSLRILAGFCALAALPLLGLVFVQTIPQFIAAVGILGFTIGAVTSSAYAVYLAKFAHESDAGRNFGLLTAAETIPYVIVPLIAAGTQEATNNALLTSLFIAGALLAMTAAAISFRQSVLGR